MGNKNGTYLGLLIAGISLVGIIAFFRKKSGDEKKSSFANLELDLPKGSNTVIFTMKNNSSGLRYVDLFNSTQITTFAQRNPDVSIRSVPDIDFFNQLLSKQPKRIKHIEVKSANNTQVIESIKILSKNANGRQRSYNILPIVSAMQAQGNISNYKPEKLILNGYLGIKSYKIQPNTIVTIMLSYE